MAFAQHATTRRERELLLRASRVPFARPLLFVGRPRLAGLGCLGVVEDFHSLA